MAKASAFRIGVDLGGSKIEFIALDPAGKQVFEQRISAPRSYEDTVRTIADQVAGIDQELRSSCSVGVGMPGSLSPKDGHIRNSPNSPWMIGHALDKDLSDAVGKSVRVANDANCFALSEASDGAAAGAEVVFGVIIGTGCGGGIAINGRPIAGKNAIAGEWGHNPLPWARADEIPGPGCGCGLSGCIETWVSGAGLVRAYGSSELSAAEIASQAENGDSVALQAIHRYADRLARALSSILNVLDPDVVVLGGGLSNIDALYDIVPDLWAVHAFSDTVETSLAKAKHGDASGVRGAAWLWTKAEAAELN